MTYSSSISRGTGIIRKNLWLLIIPVISDAIILLVNYLHSGLFIDSAGVPELQLKFAIPSALPSLKNILGAFPDLLSYNNRTGFQDSMLFATNIFSSPWNYIYMLCGVLLFSILSAFLQGGFLGCIAKTYRTEFKSSLKDFIYFGCYYWSRFLGLKMLGLLAVSLAIFFIPIIFAYFIFSFLLFYLSYALVWDDITVSQAISRALSGSTSRLGNTFGYMIFIAFLIGIISLFAVPLSRWNVFLGSILYTIFACHIVAGIMAMYAGEKAPPEEQETDGNFDIKV